MPGGKLDLNPYYADLMNRLMRSALRMSRVKTRSGCMPARKTQSFKNLRKLSGISNVESLTGKTYNDCLFV